jgi:hypothetical protein
MRLFLLLALGLVGCGGESTRDPAATGGSSAGGSSGSGGVSTGGSGGNLSGGTGGIATGGTAGTGGVSCSEFLDETPPPNLLTIRVTNAKTVPIYMGSDINCGPYQLYEIVGPNGQLELHPGGCGFTCQGLQQHGDECPDACMVPPLIYIAPGGSYDQYWNLVAFEQAFMPTECYFEPEFAYDSCMQQIVPPAGEYTAIVQASTEFTCLDIGTCSCTPDASGSCEIPYGGQPTGEILSANAAFQHPSAGMVEITIQ